MGNLGWFLDPGLLALELQLLVGDGLLDAYRGLAMGIHRAGVPDVDVQRVTQART